MSEATGNSKKIKDIKVSKVILPENKNYESESLKYEIKIPTWLLEKIQNYEVSNNKNDDNQDLIVKAFKLAYEAHNGQLRASGEPYIIHPLAVADRLLTKAPPSLFDTCAAGPPRRPAAHRTRHLPLAHDKVVPRRERQEARAWHRRAWPPGRRAAGARRRPQWWLQAPHVDSEPRSRQAEAPRPAAPSCDAPRL